MVSPLHPKYDKRKKGTPLMPYENSDELICEAEPAEKGEFYVFRFERTELRALFKKIRASLIRHIAPLAILWSVVLIVSALKKSAFGFVLGCGLIALVLYLKYYLNYKKAWLNSESRIEETTYSYEIFDNFLFLTLSRNGETVRTQKIYFNDIAKIHIVGNYLFLQFQSESLILKKDALVPDSALIAYCNRTPQKVVQKKEKHPCAIVSDWLFVLSILSIFAAAYISGLLDTKFPESMKLFFFFLPIPIASIVFGIYLKRKCRPCKKNILTGVIAALLLCLFGSFAFIFSDYYSHSDEPILNAEQMLQIDIPEPLRINTLYFQNSDFCYSTVYFSPRDTEEFENRLKNDSKWLSERPTELTAISSAYINDSAADYYLIYNADTNEFNRLPDESGTYRFINIIYDTDSVTMKLVEYQTEYIK